MKKTIEILSDLAKINDDRAKGYEEAAGVIDRTEVMLKTLFYQLAEESEEFKRELLDRIYSMTGHKELTASGNVYKHWESVRPELIETNKKTILASCELAEFKVQESYKLALKDRDDLPFSIVQLIEYQKALLRMDHDLIRRQVDEYASN